MWVPDEDPVMEACEAEWNAWKHDCSGFVRAVAKRLGVQLIGNANTIIDTLTLDTSCKNLGCTPGLAIQAANQGRLVIAGLKDKPNGHVVVIVKSPPRSLPVGYWGQLGKVGQKNESISKSFRKEPLGRVQFFSIPL